MEIISSLLVLLFVYAAVSKLLDYQTFKVQLGKSPFITAFAGTVAWALPLVEIFVALLLTFSRTRLQGLYASLFLMTLFSSYIYAILHYSYYVPCSCGGILSKMSWSEHLWFNVGFVGVAILGILMQSNSTAIPKGSSETKREPIEVTHSRFARL